MVTILKNDSPSFRLEVFQEAQGISFRTAMEYFKIFGEKNVSRYVRKKKNVDTTGNSDYSQ